MRECLGKHSCMSSPCPIDILNATASFLTVQLQVHYENPARYGKNTDALVNLITKLNSSFRLQFLRLCCNRCAEALVVNMNSLLNRPPGGSGWIISVGDYVNNSFTALGSSDPREVRLEL